MRYAQWGAWMVLTLAAPATLAAEVVVYQQPSGGAGTWTSDVVPSGAGFQTFDSFQLGQAASIDRVTWRGGTLDFGGNGPVPIDTTAFRLSFWSNAGGTPGASLFSVDVALADVVATFQGAETATGAQLPLDVYEFQADLGGAFNADTGTTYWFSVLSLSPTGNPGFAWRPGTGGDGTSIQYQLGAGGSVDGVFSRGGDRAFSLIDVPEPETGAMLLGMLGLGLFFARRRAA